MISRNFLDMADPRLTKLILHNGDIAGIIVAFPNINKSLKKCGGHLFPLGWLAVSAEKKHPTTIDLNMIGLLPQYQGLGGNVLLYSELDKLISNYRIKKAEVVQIEDEMATVRIGDALRKASLMLLPEPAQLGDYLIIHAGFALHKVDPEEARESLRLLQELAALVDEEPVN